MSSIGVGMIRKRLQLKKEITLFIFHYRCFFYFISFHFENIFLQRIIFAIKKYMHPECFDRKQPTVTLSTLNKNLIAHPTYVILLLIRNELLTIQVSGI